MDLSSALLRVIDLMQEILSTEDSKCHASLRSQERNYVEKVKKLIKLADTTIPSSRSSSSPAVALLTADDISVPGSSHDVVTIASPEIMTLHY